jgi:hypothetical protein
MSLDDRRPSRGKCPPRGSPSLYAHRDNDVGGSAFISKRRRTLALAAALSAAVAIAGCGGSRGSSAPTVRSAETGFAKISAALDLEADVDRVTLTIAGPTSLTQALDPVNATHYSASVGNLIAGSGYTFTVEAFNASNAVVLRGQAADVTIVAGRTAEVAVMLHEPAPPTG